MCSYGLELAGAGIRCRTLSEPIHARVTQRSHASRRLSRAFAALRPATKGKEEKERKSLVQSKEEGHVRCWNNEQRQPAVARSEPYISRVSALQRTWLIPVQVLPSANTAYVITSSRLLPYIYTPIRSYTYLRCAWKPSCPLHLLKLISGPLFTGMHWRLRERDVAVRSRTLTSTQSGTHIYMGNFRPPSPTGRFRSSCSA